MTIIVDCPAAGVVRDSDVVRLVDSASEAKGVMYGDEESDSQVMAEYIYKVCADEGAGAAVVYDYEVAVELQRMGIEVSVARYDD